MGIPLATYPLAAFIFIVPSAAIAWVIFASLWSVTAAFNQKVKRPTIAKLKFNLQVVASVAAIQFAAFLFLTPVVIVYRAGLWALAIAFVISMLSAIGAACFDQER